MDPVTLALLSQGIGGGLSWLVGRGQDQAERKRRREIMRLSDPSHLNSLTNQLYSQFLSSPAFAQGRRGIFNSTANTSNQLSSSLAARGLSTSGVGSIAPALANSAGAGQLGQLRTAGYNASGNKAYDLIGRQLNTMGGFGGPPNAAGAALGGSLHDMSGILMELLGGRVPKAKVRKAKDPGAGGVYE